MTVEDRELAAAGAAYSRAVARSLVTVEEFADAANRLADGGASLTGGIVVNVATPADLELAEERRRSRYALTCWRWERSLLWFALACGGLLALAATYLDPFAWLVWATWQIYTYQRYRDERRAFERYRSGALELPAARLLRGERGAAQ